MQKYSNGVKNNNYNHNNKKSFIVMGLIAVFIVFVGWALSKAGGKTPVPIFLRKPSVRSKNIRRKLLTALCMPEEFNVRFCRLKNILRER